MTDHEPLLLDGDPHVGKPYDDESEGGSKKEGVTKNLLVAIAACVFGSSFQFGYNTGVVNVPEKQIQDYLNETVELRSGSYISHSLLTVLWAVIVSIYCVGGMIGGVSAGYFANRYGRKGSLLMNNAIAVVATGLMAFSKLAKSYEMLIAGRFVMGIGAGINTAIAPLYLAEIAPTSLRGLTGTFNQLAICIGVLVSELLGQEFILGTDSLWPLVLGFSIVPVVFQLCLLPFCPETPRFLILNKELDEDARTALVWLRDSDDVADEMHEMRHEREEAKHAKKFSLLDLLRDPFMRHALIISIVMQLSQQFSGINAVIYYSTIIFERANLSHAIAEYATLGTGVLNVCMTFISALMVDRAGRRTLHLIGLGGMFIFTIILSLALIFQESASWLSYVCIAAVALYIVFFATGPGSIPWFIVAELFAQGPRPAAVSVSVLVNWASQFTIGIGFPEVQEAIGPYTFVIFSVLLAIFWLFTFFRVPETKGRTIEEIQELFKVTQPPVLYQEINIDDDDLTSLSVPT